MLSVTNSLLDFLFLWCTKEACREIIVDKHVSFYILSAKTRFAVLIRKSGIALDLFLKHNEKI